MTDPAGTPFGHASFTRGAFAATLGVFLLIGAVDAAYGPLLATVSHRFSVPLAVAGTLISIYFAGALAGVASVLAARRRVPGRTLAVSAVVTVAAGCLVMSLARAWEVLEAGAFLAGIGFGATDFTLNELVARTEPRFRAGRLNAINAAFGAGAVAGPVIVNGLRSAALGAGFAGAAVIACLAAVGLRGIASPGASRPAAPASTVSRHPRAPRSAAARFGLAYLCYVGCEAGIAGWLVTDLMRHGYPGGFATGMTSAFWAALTVARLAVIPLSRVVSPRRMVLTAAPLLALSLVLTAVPPIAPAAYVAAGLAAAPIYPVGLAWAVAAVPGDPRPAVWALTGSMIGGVVGPGAVALLVSVAGIGMIPAVLATFATASWLFLASLRSRTDH